ncbi:ABC transporter ATP-binding protein [Rhodocista pekingensis]|uniref:ABC transporter ATP-binding protein n=1 Tax=Rhodocista pekingensis TaxID=201185 RepID=A0ABW2KVT1_9PROT
MSAPLLEGRGLRLSYSGRTVLAEAGVALGRGELVGLIGPNGAGKTTLLKCLAGLLRADAGTATLDGTALDRVPPRLLARRLAYLAQSTAVHWPLTVERVVALGRLPHLDPWRAPGAADAAAIERALSQCGVGHLRDRVVTTLSGGERARVLLARALAVEPDLLLADEPVAGLDPYHQLQVMEVLRQGSARGMGTLVVLHDLTLAARYCDRVVLLSRGGVAADGPPAEVLRPVLLEAVYGVRMLALEAGGAVAYVPWERLGRDPES